MSDSDRPVLALAPPADAGEKSETPPQDIAIIPPRGDGNPPEGMLRVCWDVETQTYQLRACVMFASSGAVKFARPGSRIGIIMLDVGTDGVTPDAVRKAIEASGV